MRSEDSLSITQEHKTMNMRKKRKIILIVCIAIVAAMVLGLLIPAFA